MKKIQKNDCKKCPYYYSYYDSFTCDGDEFCGCGITTKWGVIKGCSFPLFIRHILAFVLKIRQFIWDWEAEREWLKEGRLNMDEETYFNEKSSKDFNYIDYKERLK